jgi:hypothetical protein
MICVHTQRTVAENRKCCVSGFAYTVTKFMVAGINTVVQNLFGRH